MCAPNFLNSQWTTVRGLGVKTAAGPDRIYEFKHDATELIARRDGPAVRPYTRNANDRAVRLAAISCS